MTNVTLQQLLAAGVHFGHKVSRWNPKMLPYIHEEKNDIHILDLVKSLQSLEKANSFCKKSASEGKTFLFVGTKPYIRPLIAKEAERSNSLYVNQRWLGGMLTNWITLKNRITDLKNLENQQKEELSKFSNVRSVEEAYRMRGQYVDYVFPHDAKLVSNQSLCRTYWTCDFNELASYVHLGVHESKGGELL